MLNLKKVLTSTFLIITFLAPLILGSVGWWNSLNGNQVNDLTQLNSYLSQPAYKQAKAVVMFFFLPGCPHCLASWKFYNDGVNQFKLAYPQD